MCDLILRQLERCRHNEAAFRFLKLWNVWVLSWADQFRATLHLDRKRTVFINRAETVVFTERGKNRFDAFEFLLVFRILTGENLRRLTPCVASGRDDPADARP